MTSQWCFSYKQTQMNILFIQLTMNRPQQQGHLLQFGSISTVRLQIRFIQLLSKLPLSFTMNLHDHKLHCQNIIIMKQVLLKNVNVLCSFPMPLHHCIVNRSSLKKVFQLCKVSSNINTILMSTSEATRPALSFAHSAIQNIYFLCNHLHIQNS